MRRTLLVVCLLGSSLPIPAFADHHNNNNQNQPRSAQSRPAPQQPRMSAPQQPRTNMQQSRPTTQGGGFRPSGGQASSGAARQNRFGSGMRQNSFGGGMRPDNQQSGQAVQPRGFGGGREASRSGNNGGRGFGSAGNSNRGFGQANAGNGAQRAFRGGDNSGRSFGNSGFGHSDGRGDQANARHFGGDDRTDHNDLAFGRDARSHQQHFANDRDRGSGERHFGQGGGGDRNGGFADRGRSAHPGRDLRAKQYVYHGRKMAPFRVARFSWPRGYGYRRLVAHQRIPLLFFTADYYIVDYGYYGVPPPPMDYEWLRYGPDLVLADTISGSIADVIYGVFEETDGGDGGDGSDGGDYGY